MSDEQVKAFLPWLEMVGMLTVVICILAAALWRRLVDRWIVYRLRVARRARRAGYIRWWREQA